MRSSPVTVVEPAGRGVVSRGELVRFSVSFEEMWIDADGAEHLGPHREWSATTEHGEGAGQSLVGSVVWLVCEEGLGKAFPTRIADEGYPDEGLSTVIEWQGLGVWWPTFGVPGW